MPRYFEPYISYRLDEKGGGVRDFGLLSSGGLLSRYRSIVFLVHGYNNDQQSASAAYERLIYFLGGGISANLVGVYWPGDNWSSGAYYMQAVQKVPVIARRFARDIHTAAAGAGALEVSFVAHSLGCRLTLETLRELRDRLQQQPVPGLRVRRVVFMAGAVPTFSLETQRPLNKMVRDLAVAVKSLYSEADRVLRYAFPTGQTLTGEGFFPTALGRTHWGGSYAVSPTMQQTENPTADHSDYWGGQSANERSLRRAATEIRTFIPMGGPPAPRAVAGRDTAATRPSGSARTTPVRIV